MYIDGDQLWIITVVKELRTAAGDMLESFDDSSLIMAVLACCVRVLESEEVVVRKQEV